MPLFVFLVTFAAFAGCFDFGLVNLDDYCYIIRHREIVDFAGWASVKWCFTDVSESIWMPLTYLSYALDHALFGSWYGGYHLHSVFIHSLNAALVYRLLSLLLPRPTFPLPPLPSPISRHSSFFILHSSFSPLSFPCLLAALFWAIHPLRCESVVFLASRKDVLSFFFELLALICWVRGSLLPSSPAARSTLHEVRFTSLSLVFFLLGALCKPSVMTFPLLCLILDFCIIRRVRPLRYIAPFLLMLALGAFAAWQQSVGGATANGAGEPLYARVAIAASAFGMYLKNTVWPLDLAAQCIKRWPEWPRFLLPGLLLSAAWALFLVRRFLHYFPHPLSQLHSALRTPHEARSTLHSALCTLHEARFPHPPDFLFAGMAWFAVAVAPMLGLASFGYHAFADRFTYIPAVGLSLILSRFLSRPASHLSHLPPHLSPFPSPLSPLPPHLSPFPSPLSPLSLSLSPLPPFFILHSSFFILSLLLFAATVRQTGFWRDDETLFSHTLAVDGDRNYIAHNCLALHYFEVPHDLEKARAHIEKARAATPEAIFDILPICALTLVELGDDDAALDLVHDFSVLLDRHFGIERASDIRCGSYDLTKAESRLSISYRFARIALDLGRKPCLKSAAKELRALRNSQSDNATWQYLLWRTQLLAGENAEAAKTLARLVDPSDKIEYAQYRFLRSR